MAIKDPIKEIMDEFEDKVSLYKKEREEALLNFKNAIHQRKIEDIKQGLISDEKTLCKK